MPHRIRRWPRSKLDQYDIWFAISEDSVGAADRVLEGLDRAVQLLAEYPEAGRERGDLGAGLRYYPTGSYLIFYTVSDDTIEVRRICTVPETSPQILSTTNPTPSTADTPPPPRDPRPSSATCRP
ncbi:MAG: type II toxin-antitoxin system RelE/ParE family toxin [Devosia sp.]